MQTEPAHRRNRRAKGWDRRDRLLQVQVFSEPDPASEFLKEPSAEGEFERQEDAFRELVTSDGSSPYPAAAGRYHLYISLACPWASRTLIVRNLKGLQDAVGVTVVDPIRDDRGWAFGDGPGHTRDPVNGFAFLSEAYVATDRNFEGRVTVPVLWDKQTRRIVNNSEDDICRMFNDVFHAFGNREVDLFPKDIEGEHAKLAAFIYDGLVGRCSLRSMSWRRDWMSTYCFGVWFVVMYAWRRQ